MRNCSDALVCRDVVVLQGGCIAPAGNELLHLARGSNGYFCFSVSTLGSNGFHLLHYVHTFRHLPKDNVLAIQPRGHNGRDEELRRCELDLLCVSGVDEPVNRWCWVPRWP